PDSYDNLFGFDPRTDDIIEEIQAGTILTNGETPKFWVRQMRAAQKGHTNPKIVHNAQEMMSFLAEIQGLFLEDPFQFTPGSEFSEAIEILKGNSPDPMKALVRELLAAELNHVSGRGMIEEGALQSVMLAWVEQIVYDLWNPEINLNVGGLTGDPSRDMLELGIGDPEIGEAIDFLESLNLSIGGGSGGGG
ncbi:MAG: hypothetical protein KOO63_14475, partial [Bacteroidales bacterium]|nr:hypothetical protein [Candidatus Latescibacterota bacterium]